MCVRKSEIRDFNRLEHIYCNFLLYVSDNLQTQCIHKRKRFIIKISKTLIFLKKHKLLIILCKSLDKNIFV